MGRKDKVHASEGANGLTMGTRLRYARQSKKVSLTAMADLLGYTKGYLSGVENGNIRVSAAWFSVMNKHWILKQASWTRLRNYCNEAREHQSSRYGLCRINATASLRGARYFLRPCETV